MLNTSNRHREVSEIIFKMLKKVKVCIREDSILEVSFLLNQEDSIGKKREGENGSVEVPKT